MNIFASCGIALESLLDKEFLAPVKPVISEDAMKLMKHEVALGLVLSCYEFQLNSGVEKETAKKHCTTIISSMLDDGECNFGTMQAFLKKTDAMEKSITVVVSDKPEARTKLAELKTLISFSQSDAVAKLTDTEKAIVADFTEKMKAYQEATHKLAAFLETHVSEQTQLLLKTYRQFPQEFTKLFE